MAKVLFINNDGGGFAQYVELSENMTVEQFFKDQMGDVKSSDYLIKVNREPVVANRVLEDNDRITVVPVKIEGARI